jgi:hypothetical protein
MGWCPPKLNTTAATLVRYFSPDAAKEKGLNISDFETLNEHPELMWIYSCTNSSHGL